MASFDDLPATRFPAGAGGGWLRVVVSAILLIYALWTGVILVSAFVFDARRGAAPHGAESVLLGPTADWLVDFGTIQVPDGLYADDAQRRFRVAAGEIPVTGMQYFRDGALWLRFEVPRIDADDPGRTLRLSDTRVRHAWLVWRDGAETRMREWRFDGAERRSGLAGTGPAFHFAVGEMEGKEVYFGFTSLSVLRGLVYFETRRAYQSAEFAGVVVPSLLAGALCAIGVYLCITGAVMREMPIVAAGIMSLALFATLAGGAGIFHTFIFPQRPSLADFVAYMPRLLALSAWLVFLIGYLDLRVRSPGLTRVLMALALLIPFQALLASLKIGFGWNVPLAISSSIPMFAGLVAGLLTLLWHVQLGNARARIFLVCWLPLLLGMVVRATFIMFPSAATAQLMVLDTFMDIVLSMVALSVVMVLDLQSRERTLRRRAQDDEQRLREFSRIASHSFFETGPGGVVSSATGPLASELGLLPGARLGDVRLEAVDRDFGESMAGMEAGRSGVRDAEFFVRRPDGPQKWYAFNVQPWRDENGANGLRGTIEDVTERVERRLQLAQQGKLAAMGQLAGGIAHEVNNLLHPVINLARRVRDRHVRDSEGRRLLDLVIDSGKRAGEVVEGVLESVSANRRGPAQPLSTAVERAVAAAMAAVPPQIRVRSALEPVESPVIHLGEMLQVIGNLVQNAAQAISGAGEIVVSLTVANGWAELVVRDDGRGMSEELRGIALQPFVTSRSNGTGLGLSAVASVVAGWKGTIELLSREGEGTSVVIRIPETLSDE